MPLRASRPCKKAGCPGLTNDGPYCSDHKGLEGAANRERLAARDFKYDRRWRKRRDAHLRIEPLCRHCGASGIIKAATDVDHITPLSQGGADDDSNYQSLCHECHSCKTAREDGGFGRIAK